MTFDLIVRNATLPDGRAGQDIACADGRIWCFVTARGTPIRGALVSPAIWAYSPA